MPVTSVDKDATNRTLTLTAEFPAPPARVWQVWEDPRQLERWWGPPTHPATFTDHDLSPGGHVRYFMTGPEGEKYHGIWRVVSVEAARRLEVEDLFADETGEADPTMPTTLMEVTLTDAAAGGTVMTITSRFPSDEAMEQVLAMGAAEGMTQAMSQIDVLLA